MPRRPQRPGSQPAGPDRPFGLPRWAGYGLYSLFSFLLLIPLVRRWRRHPRWIFARLAMAATAADPDRERKIQRRHQAQYLLNGGLFAGGRLPSSEPLATDRSLYLLIRGEHLLLTPQQGDAEVHSAFPIARIRRIEVDGEAYLPIYVSEATDPPVKETQVDRRAVYSVRERLLRPQPAELIRLAP